MQLPFFTGTPGVLQGMEEKSPLEFFRLLFNDGVMDVLFSETRRYIQQYLDREQDYTYAHPQARAHEWHRTPLLRKELDIFLALVIGMGVAAFQHLGKQIRCNDSLYNMQKCMHYLLEVTEQLVYEDILSDL